MSIDDIIRHIDEDCYRSYHDEADYAWVELQYIPKIVALLKAGQAMRDAYYTAKTAPGDNLDCDNAIGDWDEATKENV
jgi:hypothetical protein